VPELNPALKQLPGFSAAHKELQILDKKIKKGIRDAKKSGAPDFVIPDVDKSRKAELIAQLGKLRDQVEPERAVRIREQQEKNEAARQRNLNRKQPRLNAATSDPDTDRMDIPTEGTSISLISDLQGHKRGYDSSASSLSGKPETKSQIH